MHRWTRAHSDIWKYRACHFPHLSLCQRRRSQRGWIAASVQAWRLRIGSSSGGAGLIKPWENYVILALFPPLKAKISAQYLYLHISIHPAMKPWQRHCWLPTRLIKHLPTHTHTRAAVSNFILVQSTNLCCFAACYMSTLTLLLHFQALSPSALIIFEPYWDKWHEPTQGDKSHWRGECDDLEQLYEVAVEFFPSLKMNV